MSGPKRFACGHRRICSARGNASIEFVGIVLVLIAPLVYLILTLAVVQAATLASANAAREAGRVFVSAPDAATAHDRALVAADLALADQGVTGTRAADALTIGCEREPCLTPGGHVRVAVRIAVAPPLLETILPGGPIRIEAHHLATVGEFHEVRP